VSYRVEKAAKFFRDAHDSIGHKRKYTGVPYWHHTEEVMRIVKEVNDSENVLIAALGHDCLEDVWPINPKYSFEVINKEFGNQVACLIYELTDRYTSNAFPGMNRKIRKLHERARMKTMSDEAKTIKLADLIDNTKDIVKHDPNFAKVYMAEKISIMTEECLKGGNHTLHIACLIQVLSYTDTKG
jgi:guanosine-3',5'-bis(diphosphate) 3'-pyrophosphohydrolase